MSGATVLGAEVKERQQVLPSQRGVWDAAVRHIFGGAPGQRRVATAAASTLGQA